MDVFLWLIPVIDDLTPLSLRVGGLVIYSLILPCVYFNLRPEQLLIHMRAMHTSGKTVDTRVGKTLPNSLVVLLFGAFLKCFCK